MAVLSTALAMLCLVSPSLSYQHYQNEIPNGEEVKNPWVTDPNSPNYNWQGVGHLNAWGGGKRNPFGLDFAAQGRVWNEALCKMDSDMDGKSNGVELGDPECKWKPGAQPDLLPTGHPGICEPINTVKCQGINDGVDVEDSEPLDCPAIKSPDVKVSEFRFNKTEVPAKETSYFCQYFPFNIPEGTSEHIIAFEPILDNLEVIHHMVMYACREGQDSRVTEDHRTRPSSCSDSMQECSEVVLLWALGVNGDCYGDKYGGRIGKGGYVGAWIETHWNNPLRKSGMTDSSGMKVYHTPNLRPYDAAFVLWGPTFFRLPPGRKKVSAGGICRSERTWEMSGPVNITVMTPHMHLLGKEMKVIHIRYGQDGRTERDVILHEKDWDYNDPTITKLHEKDWIEFWPGDELEVYCTWNTESQTETTVFGEATQDEMCFFVAQMHPFDHNVPVFCGEYIEISGAAGFGASALFLVVASILTVLMA